MVPELSPLKETRPAAGGVDRWTCANPNPVLVIEREHEIQFQPHTFYTIGANFEISNRVYQAFSKSDLKKTAMIVISTGFGTKKMPNNF